MHALLHAMAVGMQNAGAFLLDLPGADDAFYAEDVNGQTVTGTLDVKADGSIDWTGDTSGVDELGGTWWDGTPVGTWHVRLTYTSGTNQYISGDGLNTWDELNIDRTWVFQKTTSGGPDQTDGVYLLEFSDDAGSSVHDSVSINDISLFEESP